jgi:beta-glucanase (GH16 family)
VRAKLPDPRREAIWPAIWLMNCGVSPLTPPSASSSTAASKSNSCSGQEVCWPTAGEIDIMEMVGQQQNNSVLGTYHWGHECSADQCESPRASPLSRG